MLSLLSYPLSEIDPSLNAHRDEGETRISAVRDLLRVASNTRGLERFCDATSNHGLAELLVGPSQAGRKAHHKVMRCLFPSSEGPSASDAPTPKSTVRCCMVKPSVRTLSPMEADKLDLDQRALCIPVQGKELVALPGEQPLRQDAEDEKVVVTWPAGTIQKGTGEASISISRAGEGVRLRIVSCTGNVTDGILVTSVPKSTIDGLFRAAPVQAKDWTPSVPRASGELPEALKQNIAFILQTRLRLHCLSCMAGPENSSRPIAFDKMKVFRIEGKEAKGGAARTEVRVDVHPSSATCVCCAHNLPPIQERKPNFKFPGKSTVQITMQICGARLQNDGQCALHQNNTCCNDLVPGICCANLRVYLSCRHMAFQKDEKKDIDGLGIVFDNLNNATWKIMSGFLAQAASYERIARQFFGKDAPKDSVQQLKTLTARVKNAVNRLKRKWEASNKNNGEQSSEELLRSDIECVETLREGGVTQAPMKYIVRQLKRVDSEDPPLSEEQKKLSSFHYSLFPRHGNPAPKRLRIESPCNSVQTDDEKSGDNRPNPLYNHLVLVEYIDIRGLAELRRQLEVLSAGDLPPKQHARATFFEQFLNAVDAEYGPEIEGPLGLPARALECEYRSRHNGGRLYPSPIMPQAPSYGKKKASRFVCGQGMPREVRPFLFCRWGHDYDLKNAQPEMLRQMPATLSWADGRVPPKLPELEKWCFNRDEFIEHVAEVHNLPSDSEKWADFRKDLVKLLMVRLLFGGKYQSWIKEDASLEVKTEPRSPRVTALAIELETLRHAVFESEDWRDFYRSDADRLRRTGDKEDEEEIDRSVFARIAQKTENEVLASMRSYLAENNWQVLTLCFDGLIVKHRPEKELDLLALNNRILRDTSFKLEVVEKPLFSSSGEFPVLSLDRE